MIDLFGNLKLDSDGMQYILKESAITEKGKRVFKTKGYFTTASQAVNKAIDLLLMESVKDGVMGTLAAFIDEQTRLVQCIEDLLVKEPNNEKEI